MDPFRRDIWDDEYGTDMEANDLDEDEDDDHDLVLEDILFGFGNDYYHLP